MMKSRDRRKKNSPNAGFTLLEIVLAVSILALISIPLLRYFMNAIRYSASEANRQQALFYAQGITEGLLAENRLVTYEPDSGAAGVNYAVPFLEEKGYRLDTSDPSNDNPLMTSGTGEAVFWNTVDGYNVRVTITNKSSGDLPVKDVTDLSEYGINLLTDVVLVETTEYSQAVFYFMELHRKWLAGQPEGTARWGETEIEAHMSRVIHVSVATTDDPPGYRVRIRYGYECSDLNNFSNPVYWEGPLLVDKNVSDLQNVFLFYDWCDGGDWVRFYDYANLATGSKKIGLNIIYRPREGGETQKDPGSGYSLKVSGEGAGAGGGYLSVYTNVGTEHVTLENASSFGNLNVSAPGADKSTLVFYIRTEVYPAGSWKEEDRLAKFETTKGE